MTSSQECRTEITVVSLCKGKELSNLVRLRGGQGDERTQVEVITAVSKQRIRRRRKERRGKRWMLGKLSINFGALGRTRQRPSIDIVKLGTNPFDPRIRPRDRLRGRDRDDHHRKTIRGIPFNYYYTLGRIFTKLSVPKQRPHSDLHIRALSMHDNGNYVPLSVVGISTALVDLGYSQKDYMVAAKAVIDNGEIFVEPTKLEEQRVNLERILPGQGLMMMEYFALTGRVAHIFTKGQISFENYKKMVAMCVASCQTLSASTISLLRERYDKSMVDGSWITKTAPNASPAKAAAISATPAVKASFANMLSGSSASVSQMIPSALITNKPSAPNAKPPVSASAAVKVTGAAGKKLTLADLAKGKK